MGFFGSLLGGGLIRAGERFHEEADRQHELDKWQRSQRIKMYSDFMDKNWNDMNSDQQDSFLNTVAPDIGIKNPKDMQSLHTAFKAIHSMIPQIQATPESMGPVQRGGEVTTTPSAEPDVRGIAAPAAPQFSQLPQPASTLSPAIMAPSTGGTAVGPSLTPNEELAQRKADQAAELRRQEQLEIGQLPVSEGMKQAARMKQYGVNVVPIETANIRGETERYKVDKQALSKGDLKFFAVPGENGSSHIIHGKVFGGKLYNDTTGEQIDLPVGSEPIDKKVIPIVNDVGDLSLVNPQRALMPNSYRAVIPGAGKKYHAPANAVPIAADDVASVAEKLYQGKMAPSQVVGGMGVNSLKSQVQRYMAQKHPDFDWQQSEAGFKFGSSSQAQNQYRSMLNAEGALTELERLSDAIPRTDFQPLNRAYLATLRKSGNQEAAQFETAATLVSEELGRVLQGGGTGNGTSDAKIKLAMNVLDQGYSGPQFKAVIKEARNLLATRRGTFTSGTFIGRNTSQDSLSVTAPNGKVYSFPTKEAADKFRSSIGAR